MHGETCSALIKDIGEEFEEIQNTTVDMDARTVTITFDEGLDLDLWKEEVEALGEEYEVHEDHE